ncbi:unnamed protein product, partial [Allacma fusca]
NDLDAPPYHTTPVIHLRKEISKLKLILRQQDFIWSSGQIQDKVLRRSQQSANKSRVFLLQPFQHLIDVITTSQETEGIPPDI